MPNSRSTLGLMTNVYGVQPAYMQRAVFVAILSFMFFLAMMFAFYLRQHFGYFLLSTAFLLVYLVTMFSWVMQRGNAVKIFENGIEYRKFSCLWSEIESVDRIGSNPHGLTITSHPAKKVDIPSSIKGIDEIEFILRDRMYSRER